MRRKKVIAVGEIYLMVIATVAFAFILSSSFADAAYVDPTKPKGGIVEPPKVPSALPTPNKAAAKGATSMPSSLMTSTGLQKGNAVTFDNLKVGDATGKFAIQNGKVYEFKGGVYTESGKSVNDILSSAKYTEQPGISGADVGGKVGDKVFMSENGKNAVAVGQDGTVTQTAQSGSKWSAVSSGGGTGTYEYKGLFGFTTGNYFVGNLVQGLSWAAIVVTAVQLLGRLFGASDNLVNSLSVSLASGIIAGKVAVGLFGKSTGQLGGQGLFGQWLPNWGGLAIGVAVAAVVFIAMYKETTQKIVTYSCQAWEAPLGGSQCEKCNKDPFRPCSEYRCKALGQACSLLNKGTGNETCAWISKFDVNSPVIEVWKEALKGNAEDILSYVPDNAIRPPMRGTKIIRSTAGDGCLKAFTPLRFGISLNEPARCKLDYNHTAAFKDMQYYFGDSNMFAHNHTQKLRLPGPSNANSNAPELKNDGTYSIYTRCQDANGNENVDEFVFNFCVDKSPDTTPPVVEGSSILDGSPVRYAVDTLPIQIYVNEPADCKWSRQDKAYEDMENSMQCATGETQINSELLYACLGNLTAIKDRQDNKFYFRCKDNPDKQESERNVNVQSFPLAIKGSQPLTIIDVKPNGTIYGSTSINTVTLEIETSNGADEKGTSTCYYSPTNSVGSFISMFETNNYRSRQSLDLEAGDFQYFFKCIDGGGNSAETNTTFTLFVDKQAPKVTRVYREIPDALKVVMNEEGECAYSLTSCNFNFKDGIKMIYSNPSIRNIAYAQWKVSNVYHIKCRDAYGNEPNSGECNVVASATQLAAVSKENI